MKIDFCDLHIIIGAISFQDAKFCFQDKSLPAKTRFSASRGGLTELDDKLIWKCPEYVHRFEDSWWKRVSDNIPRARIARYGPKVVAVGCRDVSSPHCKFIRTWDGKKWSKSTEMIKGCVLSCTISKDNYLIVMGGLVREKASDKPIRDVQIFDGDKWYYGPQLPKACCQMSAVVLNDTVYVIGGKYMGTDAWSVEIDKLVVSTVTH